jgi:hypothetical protein
VVRSGVLTVAATRLASALVLAVAVAPRAAADDAVLYLGETDPRPLEKDGRPATSLPMIRFVIGAPAGSGARVVAMPELSALDTALPELGDAALASDSVPVLSSPSPGLIRLSLDLQGAKRWRTSFDLMPLDDDGRVRVIGAGREARVDGTTGVEFRRELSGWFLVYPDGTPPPSPDPDKQRGAFGPR